MSREQRPGDDREREAGRSSGAGSGSRSDADLDPGSRSDSGSAPDSAFDDTVASTSRFDETVIVPRPDASDETVMVDRKSAPKGQPPAEAGPPEPQPQPEREADLDETVMVEQPQTAEDTVMVERPQATDDTVMVDRAAVPISDETIVSPRGPSVPEPASTTASQEAREASQSLSGSVAPPVEEPQTGSASRKPRRIRHDNLDPMRRIAPAPWKATSSAEPGVRPGLPVTYGPRYDSVDGLQPDLDEVHRRIGPVPLTAPAPPPADRSALPSTRKRSRRRSIITLASYAGVIVLCVGGLITVWQLAFG